MSVVIGFVDVPPVTQLWEGNLYAKLKNSGDENVKNVTTKIVDSVIYEYMQIRTLVGTRNCLNVFNTSYIRNMDDANANFPAGTEKTIYFPLKVKADAPINVHDVPTHFIYEVY